MNDNNNYSVGHNPSENDGASIGDIDVDDIPTLYNFSCHAPTDDADSNDCCVSRTMILSLNVIT